MEQNNIEQRSQEWIEIRLGKITASRMKDVLAKGRGSAPSLTRRKYMIQLIAERLTGLPSDSYTNATMEWGIATEPEAIEEYCDRESVEVEKVGFISLNEDVGCSPDGLVGEGLLEIKCPLTTTQIEWFLAGVLPSEHKAQVQAQLWVTGRQWCDFVSFDPRIHGDSRYFKVRVRRDEEYIAMMKKEVDKFLFELEEILIKI